MVAGACTPRNAQSCTQTALYACAPYAAGVCAALTALRGAEGHVGRQGGNITCAHTGTHKPGTPAGLTCSSQAYARLRGVGQRRRGDVTPTRMKWIPAKPWGSRSRTLQSAPPPPPPPRRQAVGNAPSLGGAWFVTPASWQHVRRRHQQHGWSHAWPCCCVRRHVPGWRRARGACATQPAFWHLRWVATMRRQAPRRMRVGVRRHLQRGGRRGQRLSLLLTPRMPSGSGRRHSHGPATPPVLQCGQSAGAATPPRART